MNQRSGPGPRLVLVGARGPHQPRTGRRSLGVGRQPVGRPVLLPPRHWNDEIHGIVRRFSRRLEWAEVLQLSPAQPAGRGVREEMHFAFRAGHLNLNEALEEGELVVAEEASEGRDRAEHPVEEHDATLLEWLQSAIRASCGPKRRRPRVDARLALPSTPYL